MTTCFDDVLEKFSEYEAALKDDSLSNHTKRIFKSRVYKFLSFLCETDPQVAMILIDPQARDLAVQRYREHVQTHLKPNSVNGIVTALNHFFQFLGLGNTNLRRTYCPPGPRRTLTMEEQAHVLTAIEYCRSRKHRAIAKLLFYTGIKIGECVSLNVKDLRFNDQGDVIIVYGTRSRTVQLPKQVAEELSGWLAEREELESSSPALFLNRQGQRISSNGIDLIVRKIGQYARIELSTQLLRRTYFANKERDYVKSRERPKYPERPSGLEDTTTETTHLESPGIKENPSLKGPTAFDRLEFIGKS
jgi:integrase/recombinase XerC